MVNQTLYRKIKLLATQIFLKTDSINGIERHRHHMDIMLLDTNFIGEENRSTRKKPLTCRKSLTHFIT
jgi:hypothetical protein